MTTYKLPLSVFVIWLFHLSGIIGILLGAEDWFIQLTPLNLGICFLLLVWNIKPLKWRDMVALCIPFIIGIVVEFLGVNYGLIFGNYSYGQHLGYKIAGVPLMIGINWVLLVYATSGISKQFCSNKYLSALVAALMMVLLDFLIEKSAPYFDFWTFDQNVVPFQNYVGWLMVGFVAQLLFQHYFTKENKILSWNLYIVMLVFFAVFYFYHS